LGLGVLAALATQRADAQRLAERPAGAVAAWAPTAVAPSEASAGARTDRFVPIESAAAVPPSAREGSAPGRGLDAPWWTPIASAALPGAGQALLNQDRFVAYLSVEGYLWLRYLSDVREGRRQRDAYRDLANRVARAVFAGPKPTGGFDYYERMEHFVESGVFDIVPGGAIDPETDTTTFNGQLWLLARRTYWANPDSAPTPGSEADTLARHFYTERAVAPAFRWSWRNAQLEQDLFRRTIARSNDAFRRAAEDLGIVIANHALSTVDAYVSLRLQRQPAERRVGVIATAPWAPFGRPAAPRTRHRQ
jgi:hypothetical protein